MYLACCDALHMGASVWCYVVVQKKRYILVALTTAAMKRVLCDCIVNIIEKIVNSIVNIRPFGMLVHGCTHT